MSSICKGCNKDYIYPSRLSKHRNGFYGCKYDDKVLTILNVNVNNNDSLGYFNLSVFNFEDQIYLIVNTILNYD